jgi:hypothetical protein
MEGIMSYLSHAKLHVGRFFEFFVMAAVFGLVWLVPPAAQAANPAEEMFKGGRPFVDGGIDPHGIPGARWRTAWSNFSILNSCFGYFSV